MNKLRLAEVQGHLFGYFELHCNFLNLNWIHMQKPLKYLWKYSNGGDMSFFFSPCMYFLCFFFHLHCLLFKLDILKAQNSSCDALGLRNLNYVNCFLTILEFISVMLWCSYLFSPSSYTLLKYNLQLIFITSFSLYPLEISTEQSLFSFTFKILTPYP